MEHSKTLAWGGLTARRSERKSPGLGLVMQLMHDYKTTLSDALACLRDAVKPAFGPFRR